MRTDPTFDATILGQPTYSLTEAARLLRVSPSTLRWWLEGAERGDRSYPPVLREEPQGSSTLTWGEFVEAGYLREYRQDIPLQRLRPLISELRKELGVPYPLATARPMTDGRELVWNLQIKLDLPEELWVVVGGRQLVLGGAADAFFKRVEFDPVSSEAIRYTVMKADVPVVVDPRRSFGLPTIRGARTETIAELALAGEPTGVVAEIYEDYGLRETDVLNAVRFEREYMRAA